MCQWHKPILKIVRKDLIKASAAHPGKEGLVGVLTTAWRASSRFSSAPALPPGFLPLVAAPLPPFWDMTGDLAAWEAVEQK
jgi:hypothetical protein